MADMKLEWAELIPGTETNAEDGISGAVRCTLRINGRPVAAYLKRGPRKRVLTEAFCALLLSGWGLRIPQPYLVRDGNDLAFASADAAYPNLSRRMGIHLLQANTLEHHAALLRASDVACSLPGAPLAAAADEAIANFDRNLQNILWNGSEEAWIDHEFSLGNHGAQPDMNKLCLMACQCGKHESMSQGSIAQWTAADRSMPQHAAEALAILADDMTTEVQFVLDRLNGLGQRLLARFPKPNDLLSGI